MTPATGLQRVTRSFQSLRAAIRALFVADGVSRILITVGLYVVVTFLLDFALNLPSYVRLTFLGLGGAAVGWVAWRRLIRPLTVPLTDDDMALFIERHHPEFNDRLISSIQLTRAAAQDEFNSPELVDALVRDTEELCDGIELKRVLVGRHVGLMGAWALGLAVFLGSLAAIFPQYAGIYVKRALGMNVRWPQKIRLEVQDFKDRRRVIARGEDLVIAVRVEKLRPGVSTPSSLTLKYKFDSGERGEIEMESAEESDRFHARFDRVTGPFTFTVSGGDDETDPHRVETLTPPSIEVIRVQLEYPRYLRRPDPEPSTGGRITAPMFTKVTFVADVNEPLQEAQFALGLKGKEELRPVALVSDTRIQGEFQITDEYTEYSFRLTAKNGLHNREALRFGVRGEKDKEPEFRILDPLVENEDVTEICRRPLLFEVRDDHGIAEISMEYQVRGEQTTEWRKIPVTGEMFGRREDQSRQQYGDKLIAIAYELDLAKIDLPGPDNTTIKLKPGDHVDLRFRAADFKDVGGRNVAVSRTIRLSVKSITDIERALQEEIDRIKQVLNAQRRKQDDEYRRARNLERKFADAEALNPDQQREVRDAKNEQNSIVDKLVTSRTDIVRVMRRGVYNRVFNETAAAKLQGAVDILRDLVGDPANREKYGDALLAVQSLEEASGARSRTERIDHFRQAQNLQSATITGIQRALDMLEKWANYQEVIRITREILEIQKRVNNGIQGLNPK